MKKIVLLLFAASFAILSLSAQDDERLIISAGQLKHISLGDNLNVVLLTADASQSEVKGEMNAFEKLNVNVHNGSMHVGASAKFSAGQTIYVVVNELESIVVGQNTTVTNEGILYGGKIKVYVQEGSVARLKTTGDVKAYSLDNLEFTIRKTPVRLNASR